MVYDVIESEIGRIMFARNDEGLCRVHFLDSDKYLPDYSAWARVDNDPLLRETGGQLKAYFAKKLKAFDLPLSLDGTDFQKKVWTALTAIPYGQTWTYKQLATSVGNPAACRAVGAANGKNKLSIVVP